MTTSSNLTRLYYFYTAFRRSLCLNQIQIEIICLYSKMLLDLKICCQVTCHFLLIIPECSYVLAKDCTVLCPHSILMFIWMKRHVQCPYRVRLWLVQYTSSSQCLLNGQLIRGYQGPFWGFLVLLIKEFKNRLKKKFQDNFTRIKTKEKKTKENHTNNPSKEASCKPNQMLWGGK